MVKQERKQRSHLGRGQLDNPPSELAVVIQPFQTVTGLVWMTMVPAIRYLTDVLLVHRGVLGQWELEVYDVPVVDVKVGVGVRRGETFESLCRGREIGGRYTSYDEPSRA